MSRQLKPSVVNEILRALRAIDADMDRVDELASARLGINRTDFRCLDVLSRRHGVTAGHLAAETGLTTGAITAAIDRLERAGYAKRAADSADRRRVLIMPTERATQLVWPLFEGIVENSKRILNGFTHRDLEAIARFLRLNREMIRAHLERLSREHE